MALFTIIFKTEEKDNFMFMLMKDKSLFFHSDYSLTLDFLNEYKKDILEDIQKLKNKIQRQKNDGFLFLDEELKLKKLEFKLETLTIKQVETLYFTDGSLITRNVEQKAKTVLNY